MVSYFCSFGTRFVGFLTACLHLLMFALVFLGAGEFAFVLLLVVVVCARSLSLVLVFLLSCALALVCIVCC